VGDVIYPRAFVALAISVNGEEVDTGVVPTRVSLTRRPHNQADSCEITVHGSAVPFDPRTVDGIFAQVFLGAVDSVDDPVNTEENRRFVGYCDKIRVEHSEKGPEVTLECRDLSALYRDYKPLPASAVPRYSDTLHEAIQRILDAVGATENAGVEVRKSPASTAALSAASHGRGAQRAIQLPRDATAWQAIEFCAGLVSKLVTVDGQEVVVLTPQETTDDTAGDTATFVFGGPDEDGNPPNLLSVESEKKVARNRKGVKVTSYDPSTRTRLEALYPAEGQVANVRRPRARLGNAAVRSSSRSRRSRSAAAPPDRDVFPANDIHTQAELDARAEAIYRQRSRQEMEGKIVTPVWSSEFLALKNADRFTLRIHPDVQADVEAAEYESRDAAVAVLVERLGMSEDAARVLLNASKNRPTDRWYARTVTCDYNADGRCQVSVDFINLIEVDQ
jgi:hypothetical protein